MTVLLKKLLKEENGLSLFQMIATVAIIGVILTLVVPAVSWLSKDTSPEKHRANAIQIVEAAKSYVKVNHYKPGTVEAITVHYFDKAHRSVKDTTLEANQYMTVTLRNLNESGIFRPVEDPQTGNEYDPDKTVIYVQEDADKQMNYWITLASGSTSYFDKMRYEDVLDGDAKVNQ